MFSSSFLNGALFPQKSMCQFRSKSSSLFYWSVLIGTVLANELCFFHLCTQILVPVNGMGD